MIKKTFIDVIREVGEEGEECLTIRPSPDFPTEYVQLYAKEGTAQDFWGKVDLTMSRELALSLSCALHDAAMELKQ